MGLAAVGLTALMVAIFAVQTPLAFPDVVALPILLVGLPILALAQVPLLAGADLDRPQVYVGSIVTIGAMGLASMAVAGWGVGLEAIGFTSLPMGDFALWTVGTFVATLVVAAALSPVEEAVYGGPHPVLLALLPRTRREKGLFAGLSLAAGFGEEVAYRGYVLAGLLLLVDQPWLALAMSSVSFGVLHAYQGSVGIVRTALMGVTLGIPVLITGSLWPSIAAHAMVDLAAGFIQGPRILKSHGLVPEVESGSGPSSDPAARSTSDQTSPPDPPNSS